MDNSFLCHLAVLLRMTEHPLEIQLLLLVCQAKLSCIRTWKDGAIGGALDVGVNS